MCGRASALLAMAAAQSASQAGGAGGRLQHVRAALAWVRLLSVATPAHAAPENMRSVCFS